MKKIILLSLAVAWGSIFFSKMAISSQQITNTQEKINVYAASSMTNVMDELFRLYQSQNNVEVVAVYASSSALARQIEQGAPADLYISANENWVDYLINKGKALKDDVSFIAENRLVLIVPKDSKIESQFTFDVSQAKPWLEILNGSRLATGNTDVVPAGMYAKEALQSLTVWETLSKHLAQTNNVRSALALVERNESPLGIVYKTDAMMSNNVVVLTEFDTSLHSKITYPLVLLNARPSVSKLAEFLQSEDAKTILNRYGFN